MRTRSIVGRRVVLVAVAALAAVGLATPGGLVSTPAMAKNAKAGPKTMVALGDSFASGPMIPVQGDDPAACYRSSNNYANQVARQLGLELTDVTCSGARTGDMTSAQVLSPESELDTYDVPLDREFPRNPPQFDALRPDTDVVTLQIGGNDIGFVDIALTCGRGYVESSCQEAVGAKDPDAAIEAARTKIAAVISQIHSTSRKAKIYVLGYPGIFKIGETASCPAMGALEDDAKYLRDIQEELNKMIREVADDPNQTYSAAASYVDVYGPSAGHTACDLPAIRWVEPIVPVNAAFPVHPNLGGMTAIRDILVPRIWPKGLPLPDTDPGLPAPPDSPV